MKRKKRIKSVLSLLMASFILSVSVFSIDLPRVKAANIYGGTDYYIDATNGNDNYSGKSTTRAWKTLTKASSVTFSPGDRILLKAGEVWNNQQLYPKGSGTEGKPIVIDMYGDASLGKPYIATNGNVSCPVTNRYGTYTKDLEKAGLTGAVVLRNQQYWEIHNLEISNDNNFNSDITTGTYVRDGISISINADKLANSSDKIMDYFRISDCYIHDIDGPSTWQKIHYGGIVFQVFGSKQFNQYEDSAYYFHDVRIENNRFYKTELHAVEFCFNWFGDSAGQYDEAGKYHEGWEQLWVRTKDLYSRDVYIGHNYCESIGQGAIQLANTKNMTVEYNEVNGFLERYNAVSCGLYLWAGSDSVMQYNEVYNGPYDEYDGTPWDMEYTNFNVTYQYNYSHDNAAGWMSYMGNSSNSIARYNLSVNDNGVIVKNMLSTNYAPSYFVNNVFVYDAAQMDYFHDEIFKDTVYFYNNVFYNTSMTTPTKWYRRNNALANAVFSNNDFYEVGGNHSGQEPVDANKLTVNPGFVGNVASYIQNNGVENIVASAGVFKLSDSSALIDAGHYCPACGMKDFFGNDIYYGDEIDIGIHEYPRGQKVENPVEKPLNGQEPDTRVNLAIGANATANYTHPRGDLGAEKLIDGNASTRWACCDPDNMTNGYPIYITIDFGNRISFDEVVLKEYYDSGTNYRVERFELQKWDPDTNSWVMFDSDNGGIGAEKSKSDFGNITTDKLRVALTKQYASEYWTPTLTEIEVYNNSGYVEPIEVGGDTHPSLDNSEGTFDLNPLVSTPIAIHVDYDGDVLTELAYYGSEGNKLRTLYANAEYTLDNGTYLISDSFLSTIPVGECTLQFVFASSQRLIYNLTVVDTTQPNQPNTVNYALSSTATANYTHPRGDLGAEKLIDGNYSTRWACCDPDAMTSGYPIYITIDFGSTKDVSRVVLKEYSDWATNYRVENFEIQSWDGSAWSTVSAQTNGIGESLTVDDFTMFSSSKIRIAITKQYSSEYWTPTIREIEVY